MAGTGSRLGSSALVRVAGLPVSFWLSGASPELFAAVERSERDQAKRRSDGQKLAERIGKQLVPRAELGRADRAFLLDLRRLLHRGDLVAATSAGRLRAIQSKFATPPAPLRALGRLAAADVARIDLAESLDAMIAREQERLLELPFDVRTRSPIGKVVIPPATNGTGGEIRIDAKSQRHRSEHAWRLLTRAATGSTPRGWFSHVGLLQFADAQTLTPPALGAEMAAQWTDNVRSRRRALAVPPEGWPSLVSRIALNPLQWSKGDYLVSAVLDQHDDHEQVVVRRTALLEALSATLRDGSRTMRQVAEALGCSTHEERLALGGFVRHLVLLGILCPEAAPVVSLDRHANPADYERPEPVAERDGWVDVYRDLEGALPIEFTDGLERGVLEALRLRSLEQSESSLPAVAEGERSWSFAEILSAELSTPHSGTGSTDRPNGNGHERSRLSDLLRSTASEIEPGATVVLDAASLNRADGAAEDRLLWPVDCLVRIPAPEAGYLGVLEQVWPAGTLDSRFADALKDLHGSVPHVEAYRQFLRRLEELTGMLFLEILAPPLADGAANAVRRPSYTSAWTGDPHVASYMRHQPGRYVPLAAIRIRRVDGRLRAEIDGQQIWPFYHATRSFSPPWDRIAQILLATAPPQVQQRPFNLLSSLAIPAGMTQLPRISVAGGLLLAPAQWVISADELSAIRGSWAAKVGALVRLRRARQLPRWIWLDVAPGDHPTACDLESLHGLRALERISRPGAPVRAVEMLPAPDELLVVDRSHPGAPTVVSQVQIRLPVAERPADAAARTAAHVSDFQPPQSALRPRQADGQRAKALPREPVTSPSHAVDRRLPQRRKWPSPGCRDPPPFSSACHDPTRSDGTSEFVLYELEGE